MTNNTPDIRELAITRERARRTLYGLETAGAYVAAREARRAYAAADDAFVRAVDEAIAQETTSEVTR